MPFPLVRFHLLPFHSCLSCMSLYLGAGRFPHLVRSKIRERVLACGFGGEGARATRRVVFFHFRRTSKGFRVTQPLIEREISKRPDKVRLSGRILFLAEDPELIRRQLAGEDLAWDTKNPANNPKLRDDISTDEITPAHYCFYFDQTLGEIPYLGLKCGSVLPIGRSDVKKGGFVCSVSGKRRGKGSSREQSPYAEMSAGIQVVIAENIERIYKQNCQNLGLLTSTNFSLIDKIRAGEEISLSEFTAGEDDITRQVIEYGGLFPFNVARMQKKVFLPPIETRKRPMTLAEKIFAKHMVTPDGDGWGRGSQAWGYRFHAGGPALQPRICHAHGGHLLRALRRQRRTGERCFEHSVLPRPPDVSG